MKRSNKLKRQDPPAKRKKTGLQLGPHTFSSRQTAKVFIKDMQRQVAEHLPPVFKKANYLLDSDTPYISIPRSNHRFEVIYDLLRRHPQSQQKIGCGIKQFEIIRSLSAPRDNTFAFRILHTDDSRIEFSVTQCLQSTRNVALRNLKEAMRNAVDDECQNFKRSAPKGQQCSLCTKTDDLETDHMHPNTFEQLRKDFLPKMSSSLKRPETFGKHPVYGNSVFLEKDEDFVKEWKAFHTQHARFRLLCSTCNRKQPK